MPFFTLPNMLSVLRVVLAAPIWYLNGNGNHHTAFAVYLFALFTDYLDGSLARSMKQETDLGKLLDPLADKILHLLIFFQFQSMYPDIAPQFICILILALILIALPALVMFFQIQRKLGANGYGKAKLVIEAIAVILLFLGKVAIASMVLWIAVGFAVLSIIGHVMLREQKK
ncbi:MAG: CDP-alcohol phosphatidyltransferase family protein [Patescibacteria group bacterium]